MKYNILKIIANLFTKGYLLCIIIKPFHKVILAERGDKGMTSYDLIWKLIELLLKNNNNKDQEQNKE